MAQRDPSEPSRLLKDLESIRTLLDEPSEPTGSIAGSTDTQLDIPLLQDIITDAPGLDLSQPLTPVSLIAGNPPAPEAQLTLNATQPLPARPPTPKPNPFLPYDQLARLAEERVQLDRLMAGHVPPPSTRPSTRQSISRDSAHTGAREVRMEARLQAEAHLILQEVIDDMMPTIEAELRNRLQDKLQQMVREQLK
tara:strand:+ start:64420 stop:65004 length:585 start_codon:yes stop_codon:yes gene_type:complete